MRNFIIVFMLLVLGCTPTPPNTFKNSNTVVDTAFVSSLNNGSSNTFPSEAPLQPSSEPLEPPIAESQSPTSSTLNLEIKENIVLDKSVTFYHYLPTANTGYKSDKVFYFLLDATTLTLQQYDKNMAITMGCDFTVSKPWTRNLTIEYNILKTSLTSETNKEINFEIGLKNSKVSYVKLGENKFYAKAPTPKQSSSNVQCASNGTEYHIIKAGENLKLLADSKCIEVRTLLNLNPKVKDREDFVVYPGEKIRIK